MRHLHRLALLTPALVLPLFPLACESSSSPAAQVTFEAGPGFEAGPPPEAGPLPEAGSDAFVPPVGVTVTVLDNVTPRVNVRVISHDATGAVTGEALTDATGKAAFATAPSMVTVLTTTPDVNAQPVAVTYLGVADGDNLRVVSPPARDVSTPAGSYDVSFAAGPLTVNANSFTVYAAFPCLGGGVNQGATVSVALVPSCVNPKNAILATASNAGGLLGFGFAKDVVGPAAAGVKAVGPLAFVAPGTTNVKASNLPAGVGNNASLFSIANEQVFAPYSGSGDLGVGGLDFPTATGFADAYQTEVTLYGVGASAESKLIRRDPTAAPANETLAIFDVATALPLIDSTPIARTVPERPVVTIAVPAGSSFATADAGVVTLSYSLNSVRWTFVVPPTTTTFKVPALPADAATYVPSDPAVLVETAVYFDASALPSYQAAKRLPITPKIGADLVDQPGRPTQPLPAGASLRLSRWLPG
jgi:hypothetical protein